MRTDLSLALLVVVASPAAAEPLFAISDDTLVARSAAGSSWVEDRTGPMVRLGMLVNRHVLAADLDLAVASNDDATWSALPSVGVKLKFLSTPENMGYTYVYAGARMHRAGGDASMSPCVGVRDFITYDIVRPWAFALEWQGSVTRRDDDSILDGGVAIGIARGEETRANFAVLVGWRRDHIPVGGMAIRSDGAFVTVSHQWR